MTTSRRPYSLLEVLTVIALLLPLFSSVMLFTHAAWDRTRESLAASHSAQEARIIARQWRSFVHASGGAAWEVAGEGLRAGQARAETLPGILRLTPAGQAPRDLPLPAGTNAALTAEACAGSVSCAVLELTWQLRTTRGPQPYRVRIVAAGGAP